jgi:hypothetical protein
MAHGIFADRLEDFPAPKPDIGIPPITLQMRFMAKIGERPQLFIASTDIGVLKFRDDLDDWYAERQKYSKIVHISGAT